MNNPKQLGEIHEMCPLCGDKVSNYYCPGDNFKYDPQMLYVSQPIPKSWNGATEVKES